jgi:hypothetical protein
VPINSATIMPKINPILALFIPTNKTSYLLQLLNIHNQ